MEICHVCVYVEEEGGGPLLKERNCAFCFAFLGENDEIGYGIQWVHDVYSKVVGSVIILHQWHLPNEIHVDGKGVNLYMNYM